MILGWRGQREGRGRFFQDVLGQILDHTSIGLFVPWLPAPVNTVRRMLLTIPPMSHRQPGFKDAVRRCIRLASQMEASVFVLAGADAADALPRPTGADKKAGWTLNVIDDWTTWPAILASEAQPSDMLAVIAARRGRPPWRSSLDRSLQQLHADYPGNNLLIVYPSEAESDAKPMALTGETPIDSTIPFDRDTPLREALDELVAAIVSSPVAREDVTRRVRRADPIPLAEGIALLHIHTPHVKGSKIGAGVSRGGAVLADGADSFKLVLLLLSQQGLEPLVHLQSLAAIARMARMPSCIEDLRGRTRNPADAASDGRERPAAG
jgi:mannitol/fructose-specific phosphotransferase system IIA component (Ntr-type)